jgi:hypothetical protein
MINFLTSLLISKLLKEIALIRFTGMDIVTKQTLKTIQSILYSKKQFKKSKKQVVKALEYYRENKFLTKEIQKELLNAIGAKKEF